jgi:MFS family permease
MIKNCGKRSFQARRSGSICLSRQGEEREDMPSIFYGWWIVVACAAITSYNGGILYYGFTAFFTPLVEEFGWSRAATSLAFGLYQMEGGLIAPVVGYFIDRLGPRKMMMASAVTVGLGFVLLSRINSLASFYAVFIFIACGTSLGFVNVGNFAVANWFVKRRGTALGVFAGFWCRC